MSANPPSRRAALASIGAVAVSSALPAPALLCSIRAPPSQLIHESASVLARKIRERELSSVEVVAAFLNRIKQVNGKLNAVVQLRADDALLDAKACDDELARGKSRGPLHGVPYTAKDSLDTTGLITAAGTLGRKAYVPTAGATVISRMHQAGAILLGKTNTPELTLSYDTRNLVYGKTNNPYNVEYSPGGSSGGAASILAASGSPLDICSDSAGSIRVPAHFCGVAGIKPTCGLVPRTGHIISFDGPLQALTHIGPMARFVADLRLVLPIIAGTDGFDPHIVPVPLREKPVDLKTLRVAWFADNAFCAATVDVQNTMKSVVENVAGEVASVSEVVPKVLAEAHRLYSRLVSADGFDWIERRLTRAGTTKSSLGMLRKPPAAISSPSFHRLVEEWDAVKSRSLEVWQDIDVLICPISSSSSTRRGSASPKSTFSYAPAINVLGWPAVAVRAGATSAGMPIGVQVVAPMWRDDIALSVAELIEQKLGGWKRINPPRERGPRSSASS